MDLFAAPSSLRGGTEFRLLDPIWHRQLQDETNNETTGIVDDDEDMSLNESWYAKKVELF